MAMITLKHAIAEIARTYRLADGVHAVAHCDESQDFFYVGIALTSTMDSDFPIVLHYRCSKTGSKIEPAGTCVFPESIDAIEVEVPNDAELPPLRRNA